MPYYDISVLTDRSPGKVTAKDLRGKSRPGNWKSGGFIRFQLSRLLFIIGGVLVPELG